MGRNILVTGAGGLVGTHVTRALSEKGHSVTALYRKLDDGPASQDWHALEGDLLKDSTVRMLDSIELDSIIHSAAVLPRQFYGHEAARAAQLNFLMDRRIIELCQRKNCHLLYMSSTSVYGLGTFSNLTEDASISPIGPYAAAKAESERKMLSELPDQSTIFRVSAPYGPGQRTRTVLWVFVERALANLDLTFDGTGSRQQDFTAASDVGNAVVCALSAKSANGIFNIAGGNPISTRELAELVLRVIPGTRSKVVASGRSDPQENYRASFDIGKPERILGWRPLVPLEDGIRALVQYQNKPE